MIKYIIIGFSNPILKKGTCDIDVLCGSLATTTWWDKTINDHRDIWFKFNTREEAQTYIDTNNFELCIPYGIQE